MAEVKLRKVHPEFAEKVGDSIFHMRQLSEVELEEVNYMLTVSAQEMGGEVTIMPPNACKFILKNCLRGWDNVGGESYSKGMEQFLSPVIRTRLCWAVYAKSQLTEDEKKTS